MILLGISMSMLKIKGGALVTQGEACPVTLGRVFLQNTHCLKVRIASNYLTKNYLVVALYEWKDMTTSDLFDKQNTYHSQIC